MKGQGMMTSLLVIIIILVAGFFIIGQFTNMLARGIEKQKPIQSCKLSVMGATAGKLASGGSIDFGVSCPRVPLTFDNEPKNAITHAIGGALYDCADRFFQGKLDWARLAWVFPDNRASCLVCNTIDFSREAAQTYRSQDLNTGLQNLIMPQTGMTYQQYFDEQNKKAEARTLNLAYDIQPSTFDPSTSNTVLFLQTPTHSVISRIATTVRSVSYLRDRATALRDFEEVYPQNYVMLVRTDAVPDICGSLLN